MDILVKIGIGVVATTVTVYDIITLPIYTVLQWPWLQVWKAKKIRAHMVSGDPSRIRNYDPPSELHVLMKRLQLDTVEKIVRYAVKQHGDKSCFGVRQILSEHNELQPNGKMFKKFDLGEYRWISYAQFEMRAEQFGRALRELGLSVGDRVAVFAETRYEWMVAAVGAFMQNITVVTLYATLSEDAVTYGLNQTEVDLVITSHSLVVKLKTMLKQCPAVRRIVYMEDQLSSTDVSGLPDHVEALSFTEMLERGEKSSASNQPPSKDDIAIIMYTSGSTGTPKGVLISHTNMLSTMTGFAAATRVEQGDVYLAYLPLAHVLELMAEMCCIMMGVRIGYSTPLTLLDSSSKVRRGCRGDCSVLRPTLMAAVPMILDRISQGIQERTLAAGVFVHTFLRWSIRYRSWWRRRGYNTPLLHRLFFSRISALLGGRVRGMASGGAPLSEATHDLVRSCIGSKLLQGYGLTETTGSATLMDEYDLAVGRVGHPVTGADIRLVDWTEGNYHVTDKPNQRGEIIIGGDNVAMGYFKMPEKTAEDFYEEDGRRWFRTGDIGEIYPNGTLKIIDRKKDLLKLQSGEYVSLGRVETILKTSPLVDNMLVYGVSSGTRLVAIVVPNARQLQLAAAQLQLSPAAGDGVSAASYEQLCQNQQLTQHVLVKLTEQARLGRLDKSEIPSRLALSSVVWTPDNNLVTAAFKLKRKQLTDFYRQQLDRLLADN